MNSPTASVMILFLHRPWVAIVLPAKADVLIGEFDKPTVADGDAVRVARQIAQNLRGASEGLLGVDHPFPRAVASEIRQERFALSEAGEFAEELQLARVERRGETFEEQAPEQA